MEAALKAKKPVVLLVGKADEGDELRFVPNKAMLQNLFYMMDIEQAAATFPEDKARAAPPAARAPLSLLARRPRLRRSPRRGARRRSASSATSGAASAAPRSTPWPRAR